jgi:hypothetical protein
MIDKEKKLIVLMPPKTASNSLKETMEKNGIRFTFPIKKISTPLIHLKLNEIIEFFEVGDLSEYKILQVTRDPYTRFVSSYFHLMRINHNVELIKFFNYDFPTFTNHFYESIKSENFIKNFYGSSSYVDHCINNRISWGGSRLFDTQKSWGLTEFNVSYFKLEEISKEISSVNNFLSTKISSLSNINKSNLDLKYSSMLTPKIKDIILEVFEEDFEFFNYEK